MLFLPEPLPEMMNEDVILVDTEDKEIGSMEKLEAHLQGRLHRAFSVFVFNKKGELLLQQRALDKYHSPGKWTNTCCSHPRVGEQTPDAAKRRLTEEMGMTCDLQYGFSFTYHAHLEKGLIENEFDHVFFCISDDLPVPNREEVASYKYIGMAELQKSIEVSPQEYSEWLKICFPQVIEQYRRLFAL